MIKFNIIILERTKMYSPMGIPVGIETCCISSSPILSINLTKPRNVLACATTKTLLPLRNS